MSKSVPRTLQKLMKRAGYSMRELAQAAGYEGASSIQRFLSEEEFRTEYLSLPIARKFCKALVGRGEPQITAKEVMALAGPGALIADGNQVPLIDLITAGGWGETADPYPAGAHTMVATSAPVGERAYALTVHGSSMEPLYSDGDTVIVDPDLEPAPGDDVVAKLDAASEATLKRYRPRSAKEIELRPLNDDYPTLMLDRRNPGKIIGVVVEHHRYRRMKRA